MERQGPLVVAKLIGVVCDLMVEDANARIREEHDDHFGGLDHALAIWRNWLSARLDSWTDWRREHT